MDYKKVYEKVEKVVNDYEDGEYKTNADGYMGTIGKIIRAHRNDEEEDEEDIKKRRVILYGGKAELVIFFRTDFSDKTDGEGLTCFEYTLKQLGVDKKHWSIVDSITLNVANYKILRSKSEFHH